jgi:hypothetical protein
MSGKFIHEIWVELPRDPSSWTGAEWAALAERDYPLYAKLRDTERARREQESPTDTQRQENRMIQESHNER